MWTVLVASFVAFVLQKEAARLTMESSMSLGAAVRVHFGRMSRNTGAPTLSGLSGSRGGSEADPSIDPSFCQAEKVTTLRNVILSIEVHQLSGHATHRLSNSHSFGLLCRAKIHA